MSDFPSEIISSQRIESLEQGIIKEAHAGRKEAAWRQLQPLRKAQHHQREAANSLLRIIGQQCVPKEGAAEVLLEIAQSHPQDADILAKMGECLEAVRDIDDLNAASPTHVVFRTVVDRPAALAQQRTGMPEEEAILLGLATSARMVTRQYDELVESSYRKLTELSPRNSAYHYNLGLFFKTRGKFEEGMKSN